MTDLTNKPAVADLPADYGPKAALPVTDRGSWVATSSGGMWSIEHPHPDDVVLDDIAWGIARTCRYGGQIRPGLEIYSVAEHSTTMTWWALENDRVQYLEDALAILLHDASEAIFGDMATPIKEMMPEFRKIEDYAQVVMTAAFGLNTENTLITKAEVKEIDKRIRVDERVQIISEPARSAGLNLTWEKEPGLEPLGVEVECMLPSQARLAFLHCFEWCCENLPERDPSIRTVLDKHLHQISGILSGLDTVEREVAADPFV